MNQKGSANIIVFIVLLLTLGGAVWYFISFPIANVPAGEPKAVETDKIATNNPPPSPIQPPNKKRGTQEYFNPVYKYAISFPDTFLVAEMGPAGDIVLGPMQEKKSVDLVFGISAPLKSNQVAALYAANLKDYARYFANEIDRFEKNKYYGSSGSLRLETLFGGRTVRTETLVTRDKIPGIRLDTLNILEENGVRYSITRVDTLFEVNGTIFDVWMSVIEPATVQGNHLDEFQGVLDSVKFVESHTP